MAHYWKFAAQYQVNISIVAEILDVQNKSRNPSTKFYTQFNNIYQYKQETKAQTFGILRASNMQQVFLPKRIPEKPF